jgi:isoleucyl-tRNA synthetase
MFIVSSVQTVTGHDPRTGPEFRNADITVQVARAAGEKCPRCWNIRTDMGVDSEHPDVCGRCAAVLRSL